MGKITAAFLSLLFPGLGQFYAGRMWRGFGILLLVVGLSLLTGGLGYTLLILLAAYDAYQVYDCRGRRIVRVSPN